MIRLNSRGRTLNSERPLVMAVINCSPDSFYQKSGSTLSSDICRQIDESIHAGADIIDVGGKSTKPGSLDISPALEIERISGAVEFLAQHRSNIWGSIDTTNATVARYAIEKGLHIVNDISGGNMDGQMIPTVASLGVPYVCMHMQGVPESMQNNPQYDDVTKEVCSFFREKINFCSAAGIKEIILDPGFGFGKTIDHNYTLVKQLEKIIGLGLPVLAGFSRKSMIYKILECSAEAALNGTTVLNSIALLKGASILRVHDAKEAMEAVLIVEKVMRA